MLRVWLSIGSRADPSRCGALVHGNVAGPVAPDPGTTSTDTLWSEAADLLGQ